jgi:hypothetical protein
MINKQENNVAFVDNTNTQNVFADIIAVSVSNETAKLKIALRNDDNSTANTTHNIIITLPHFLRLADAINKISQEVLNQIKITTDDNINP